MKRRELLKALLPVAAVPLAYKGAVVGNSIKMESGAKYIIFIDERSGIDLTEFCKMPTPFPADTPVWIVNGVRDTKVEDLMKIYKVEEST